MNLQDTTWVITGASAGIGEALATVAAEKGAQSVFLVARRTAQLARVQKELQAHFPNLEIVCVTSDLLCPQARKDLVETVYGQHGAVDIWVNNAGIGSNGCFDNLETSAVLDMVRLNVEALTDLTSQVVKRMKIRQKGAILQVGSVAGLMPVPTMGLYAATKSFVLSLTDSLNGEFTGTGVSIHCLNPAPVKTEFLDVANEKGSLTRQQVMVAQSARAVAKSAARGLQWNCTHIYPWLAWPFPLIAWLVPRFLWRLFGKAAAMMARRQNK